jgi:hypothetical protein
MKYPTSIKSKLYPSFIRQDKNLNKIKITKVFPKIGIPNCSKVIIHKSIKYKVSFSSHPWDIATMSMRGISSCQKWDGYIGHKQKLIGSIADPCAGIIYIEKNKSNKYGKKMWARAVVRFVQKKNSKGLFLEKVYSDKQARYVYSNYQYKYIEPEINKIAKILFTRFVKSITDYKIVSKTGYKIPLSKAVKQIPANKRSYRDSNIGYTEKLSI